MAAAVGPFAPRRNSKEWPSQRTRATTGLVTSGLGDHLTWTIGRFMLDKIPARFEPGRIRPPDDSEWVCADPIHEYGLEQQRDSIEWGAPRVL